MTRPLPNAIRLSDMATALPKRGFDLREWHGFKYYVRKGYRLVPCPGEAHRNAHIDNCMVCAPLWAVLAVQDD